MRDIKNIVLFLILVVIVGVALLYIITSIFPPAINLAPGTCDVRQVLFTLSDTTNAHASYFWNVFYPVQICYTDIFPGKTYAGVGPHLCTGTNTIINSSEQNNSHSGGIQKICYGDLSCVTTTGNCDFTNGYKFVASLSSLNNGHFSSTDSYPAKICCKSPSATGSSCGNGVCEVGENTANCPADCHIGSCGQGQTLCADGTCQPVCQHFNCNHNNVCENGEGCQCNDCFGQQDSCSSGLQCSAQTLTCQPHVGPTIQIIKPQKADNVNQWPKFKVGDIISFEQVSHGSKDLNITWYFGNGSSINLKNCLTGNNCNTTSSYSQQAHYIIGAEAHEINGDGDAIDSTNILVYQQGINVFAIISNPKFGDTIAQGPVYFNANQSFVSICDTTCPTGRSCYVVGNSNPLSCYDLVRPPAAYNLWFNWTFDPEMTSQQSLYGSWKDNYSKYVEFNRSFVTQGYHNAVLNVIYDDG